MEATKVLNKKKLLAPKLRFKGFSDEWQISKIEKYAINQFNKNKKVLNIKNHKYILDIPNNLSFIINNKTTFFMINRLSVLCFFFISNIH